MKKTKKIRNGRNRKGGKSFIERLTPFNANVSGPFIADDIDMNIRHNNKIGLLNEYQTRKQDAEKQYQEVERKFNENYKQKLQEDTISFKFRQESNLQWYRFKIIIGAILSAIGKVFWYIGESIGKIGGFSINLFGSFVGKSSDFLGSISKSTLLNTLFRVIIVIGIILVIIFGSLGFFSSNSSGSSDVSLNSIGDKMNAYGEQVSNMANINSFFIKTPEPPSIYGLLSSSLQSLVPERYRVSFTAFKNNVNNVFGNDLVETSIHNRPREVIKNGRYDDIIHINLNNNNEKILTMVKPKDIEIKVNYDNIANSADFNKLPNFIKNKYKNNFKKLVIEAIPQKNGVFSFPTDNIKYENNSGSLTKLEADNIENPFEDVNNDKFPLKEFNMKNYIYNKLMTNNENGLMSNNNEYPSYYINTTNDSSTDNLNKLEAKLRVILTTADKDFNSKRNEIFDNIINHKVDIQLKVNKIFNIKKTANDIKTELETNYDKIKTLLLTIIKSEDLKIETKIRQILKLFDLS